MVKRRIEIKLAVSLGCPAGIGPEVAVSAAAALAKSHPDVAVILVGDADLARRAAGSTRTAKSRLTLVDGAAQVAAMGPRKIGIWQAATQLVKPVRPGRPTPAAGAAQLAWIDEACDLVSSGVCDALVTGPVSKATIASSGARSAKRFRGHTEHLARRLSCVEVVMAFHCEALTTALVTTHMPLRSVARAVTRESVARSCFWLAHLLTRLRGRPPRLVVAGLNPHAGESGLLGTEETRVIAPGMKQAARRLRRFALSAELVGPIGAESAYRLAADGDYDGVVAMYHDQATIAGKLLGFGDMVNVTLGLPVIRTSVDHGTAYDRAGSGSASDRGMRAALSLASKLVCS